MKTTRRTKLTIQTERLLVMQGSGSLYGFCAACSDEVRLLTVAEAAALAEVNWRAIYRAVEAGELHYMETDGGALLVCRNSLNDLNRKLRG